jgi:hypothetical protein
MQLRHRVHAPLCIQIRNHLRRPTHHVLSAKPSIQRIQVAHAIQQRQDHRRVSHGRRKVFHRGLQRVSLRAHHNQIERLRPRLQLLGQQQLWLHRNIAVRIKDLQSRPS